MCDDNLANEHEVVLLRQVPWCLLVCDDVAKVIIEDVYHLIVYNCCLPRSAWKKLGIVAKEPPKRRLPAA